MSWQDIEGHDAIVEGFRQSIARGRLASTFLFVGPPGIGKRTFAFKLAQSLLCQNQGDDPLAPCGRCDACQQVQAATHPDLLLVSKPADKSEIPVALLIGGDTAVTAAFESHRTHGPFDAAVMPIGAYDPWIYNHCTPEQAVMMADAARARLIVPVHHQSFRLSNEPFMEPIERIQEALAKEHDRLAVREIGQTVVIPS